MSKQLEKLEAQKAKLTQKLNRQERQIKQQQYSESRLARKERNHRLIQKGALLEKYFKIDHLSIDETEQVLSQFSDFVTSNLPDKFKKNEK